ncbi:MAG: acyl carrier protein [Lachnoclostridium sp.]|nr:acyl carrier protein [Lachnoclostridium sp.]
MHESNKREILLGLILKNAGIEDVEIKNEMNLFEDLEYDSFCIVALISDIEMEFGVAFDEYGKLIDAMDSVESLLDFLSTVV